MQLPRKASMVGYELVTKRLGINRDENKNQVDSQKGDKHSQEEYEDIPLNEAITLPVEVGDTIFLTGRFKTQK